MQSKMIRLELKSSEEERRSFLSDIIGERMEMEKKNKTRNTYLYYESYVLFNYLLVLLSCCCCLSTSIFTLFNSMRALHSGQ